MDMDAQPTLSTETDSTFHCEGEVVTCARCGRPRTECEGDCEPVIETRGHRILTPHDIAATH